MDQEENTGIIGKAVKEKGKDKKGQCGERARVGGKGET